MLKKWLAWLHLWVGLAVGILFFIGCITGAVLVFQQELEPVLYPSLYKHSDASGPQKPLPLDSLVALARQYLGKADLNQLVVPGGHEGNLLARSKGDRTERTLVSVHPYTGALAGRVEGSSHVFLVSEELHRRLLMGKTGKLIMGIACLCYLPVLLSGLVLWWPKNKKMFDQRIRIKWDASTKRVVWDLHAVGGFFALPVLLVMCVTGLNWSFDWFNEGIYYLFDGQPKPTEFTSPIMADGPCVHPALYDIAWKKANALVCGDEAVIIGVAQKDEGQIEVEKGENTLFFDVLQGRLVRIVRQEDMSMGSTIDKWMEPVHTGSFGGIVGKVIYFLAACIGGSLPVTGFWIWYNRKWSKKKKKRAVKARAVRQ